MCALDGLTNGHHSPRRPPLPSLPTLGGPPDIGSLDWEKSGWAHCLEPILCLVLPSAATVRRCSFGVVLLMLPVYNSLKAGVQSGLCPVLSGGWGAVSVVRCERCPFSNRLGLAARAQWLAPVPSLLS